MRIAIDAMGGDHAPREIVRGCADALELGDDFSLVLIGDQDRIREELVGVPGWESRIDIEHTAEAITMDESPVDAIRQKRKSSIMLMAKLAGDREVDAVISAGNTGACVAACQLRLRPLSGVSRCGIAVTVPTFHGPVVLCDVGANIQAKPRHLHDYAIMSTLYSEQVLGTESPRVALLSIGEERVKGTGLVRQTHEALRKEERINFVGNIEGRELFNGACEVAVCDGFVGNVVLKLVEGLSEGIFKTIESEMADVDEAVRDQFQKASQRIWARHDYTEYGGAPLLGLDGVCIICHGRSDRRAIRNAVRLARTQVSQNLNKVIVADMAGTAVAGEQ